MSTQKQRLETIPQPKFKVGDTVYAVYTQQVTGRHDCPDCLGTKEWEVITKTGNKLKCECQRCGSYSSRDIPSLSYAKHVPSVQKLTIGSVRADSAPSYGDDYISYMCNETGVGSGSIYYENKLYDRLEDAQKEADVRCLELQTKSDAKPEALEAAKLSTIKLTDAYIEFSKNAIWNSWYRVRQLREDIDEIMEKGELSEDDKRDIEHALDFDKNYREKSHPLEKIIALLKEGKSDEALALIPGAISKAETP